MLNPITSTAAAKFNSIISCQLMQNGNLNSYLGLSDTIIRMHTATLEKLISITFSDEICISSFVCHFQKTVQPQYKAQK